MNIRGKNSKIHEISTVTEPVENKGMEFLFSVSLQISVVHIPFNN